jgi:hypothetical protein
LEGGERGALAVFSLDSRTLKQNQHSFALCLPMPTSKATGNWIPRFGREALKNFVLHLKIKKKKNNNKNPIAMNVLI